MLVELEFVFSKEKFKKLEINKKIDLSKYLVGVSYENEKGWMPIISNSFNLYCTRKNNEEFNIDFKIKYDDFDEKFNIQIKSDLKIL